MKRCDSRGGIGATTGHSCVSPFTAAGVAPEIARSATTHHRGRAAVTFDPAKVTITFRGTPVISFGDGAMVYDCSACAITARARLLFADAKRDEPDAGPQAWADLTDDQRAYWIALAKQGTP